jgi:hypothetical protein
MTMDTTTTATPEVRDFVTPFGSTHIFVAPGDVYEWIVPCSTRAGHVIPVGERLYVLARTSDTPYNEIGPRGHNWLCRTSYGDTVWATLEQCLDRGLLYRVRDERPCANVRRG